MGENIEAEGEIELSLGLSIGGAFRKTKEKPLSLHRRSDLNDCEIKEIDDKDACFAGPCASPFSNGLNLKEGIGNSNQQDGFLEQQRKRELHALRRQEARKKREDKQQKKGVCRGRNSIFMNHSMDDKMLLEAQEYASRVRDRAVKENEASRSERCCKKDEQRYGFGDDQTQTLSLARSHSETENKPSCGVGGGGYRAPQPSFSVVPMHYPFQLVPNNHHHHLQYLPFSNGIRFPYMMPYWAAPPAIDGFKSNQDAVGINGGNIFQPVPCRSFRPFQTPPLPPAASWDSEQNNRAEGRVEQDQIQPQSSLASTGTPVSSSSAVSDYQSTSPQGGSSSDTPSHSSVSKSEQQRSRRVSLARDPKGRQSEHSDSSLQMEAGRDTGEANDKSNTAQSSPQRTEESISLDKNEGGNNNPTPELGEEEKMSSKPSVPEMPCVSTTGNGPNGKTISGFLYRYTKSEVSIVCVCHGNSFTPAEFVKHAGGTDISHPLRHIVVVPSSSF